MFEWHAWFIADLSTLGKCQRTRHDGSVKPTVLHRAACRRQLATLTRACRICSPHYTNKASERYISSLQLFLYNYFFTTIQYNHTGFLVDSMLRREPPGCVNIQVLLPLLHSAASGDDSGRPEVGKEHPIVK